MIATSCDRRSGYEEVRLLIFTYTYECMNVYNLEVSFCLPFTHRARSYSY